MNLPSVYNWNTQAFSEKSRHEAWDLLVNESYGKWSSNLNSSKNFYAEVRAATAGGIKIINCICDPCGAKRTRQNISQDDSEFLAIQVVLEGQENMLFANNEYSLGPGDVFVWNSTQPTNFDVIERLHKISLLVPIHRLKEWMPSNWHLAGGKLPIHCTNSMLLKSMISEMAKDNFGINPVDDVAISEAVITMLTSSLSQSNNGIEANPDSLKDAQLYRIKKYIAENIDDADLGVEQIALANRISVRYVHWVFKGSGFTVSQYIMEERLNKARRDLTNPAMSTRSISEIAYSCGFSSSAHFSSRYKKCFGEAPSDTRANDQP